MLPPLLINKLRFPVLIKPITLFSIALINILLSDVNNRDEDVIIYGNFCALADASPIRLITESIY